MSSSEESVARDYSLVVLILPLHSLQLGTHEAASKVDEGLGVVERDLEEISVLEFGGGSGNSLEELGYYTIVHGIFLFKDRTPIDMCEKCFH